MVSRPVVGDLADHRGLHVPLGGDRGELLEAVRADDRHHPLLGLRHEDLAGGQGRVAQQDLLQVDVHPAVAVRGHLGRRAGDARRAEVLDALHHAGGEQLQAALDEHLLHEGVAHLHAGPLGGLGVVERLAGQDRRAADAVAAGARAEQHHLVAHARGAAAVHVLVPHHADAQRVDQRVALVGRVEHDLAADVRQAQAVAVAADARDHAVHDARGVRVVDRAEPELVHHRDRAGAHRHDVAHDPADPGGRALVGLDVARVVVGLDLERHRPAVADVDDARVLAHADQQVLAHLVGGLGAELAQVHLGGLVRAVLGPHHRVHRELGRGGAAAEEVDDALVLVGLEAELRPGHLDRRGSRRRSRRCRKVLGGLLRAAHRQVVPNVAVALTGSGYPRARCARRAVSHRAGAPRESRSAAGRGPHAQGRQAPVDTSIRQL